MHLVDDEPCVLEEHGFSTHAIVEQRTGKVIHNHLGGDGKPVWNALVSQQQTTIRRESQISPCIHCTEDVVSALPSPDHVESETYRVRAP